MSSKNKILGAALEENKVRILGGLFTQVNVTVQVTNRLLLPMRKSVAITES